MPHKEDDTVQEMDESTVEKFQNVWSSEMQPFLNGVVENDPNVDHVSTVWFDAICTAIKIAAEKTLPSRNE